MLLRRNIFLLGKNKRLLFHCQSRQIDFQSYSNLKVLPGGDPEREFEEGSFQFFYLIRKGEILLALAQYALGCY